MARDDGGDVDLDEPFGPGEAAHDEAGRAREDALEPTPHDPVDGLSIADVGQVDDDLADILEEGAGFFEQLGDIRHRLLRLRPRVARTEGSHLS